MKMHVLALTLIATYATGCATILSGSKQKLDFNTEPAGARCELQREGKVIAVVDSTPATIEVNKTKNVISVTCAKEGYKSALTVLPSGSDGNTLGNIILGPIVGGLFWGVDSATGSDNTYPAETAMNLIPDAGETHHCTKCKNKK